MKNRILSEKEWEKLRSNRALRNRTASSSLWWFFHLYFSHYIEFKTAAFQEEMISKISNPSIEHVVIMAFRSSGKSTIVTTAFPLWSVMGVLQKKYVVIVSQTQAQAQQHLKNIAYELESNELISKDFMPYEYEDNELGVSAITLPKFGARIIAVSREQGVRGLRSGPHRPDLIIADDVEDSQSVRTTESRHKTHAWFTGELLPLGSEKTKFVTIGNLLHEDSLLMRLKDKFSRGSDDQQFLEYPLVENDKPLWPARFPNQHSVDKLEHRIGNPVTWQREYMLHLIPDEDQIITHDMIHYYQSIPEPLNGQEYKIVAGVDLAISQKDHADNTSMVILHIFGRGDAQRIYIAPKPINDRLTFTDTIDVIEDLSASLHYPTFYIESVAYQQAVIEATNNRNINAIGVKPIVDKRSRLNMISQRIATGVILFPESGCEDLIAQLAGFGIEKHDDLVDALTIAVLEHAKQQKLSGTIRFGRNTLTNRLDRSRSSSSSMDLDSSKSWRRVY